MTSEIQAFHERLRAARRSQGLTQSELADAAGCTQSGVSMFESGRTDALSQKTVRRLAERLDVQFVPGEGNDPNDPDPVALTSLKYCPIDDCPSNIPYVVRSQLYFKPTLVRAATDETTRCALCGDVLQAQCPNPSCDAAPAAGGACPRCGTPYITATRAMRGPLDRWVRQRRDEIHELWTMSEPGRHEA